MRMNKQIAALTAAAGQVQFPAKEASSYLRFREELATLVRENFNVRDIRWDEYEQNFYWQEDDVMRFDGLDCMVNVKRTFSIDPRKPLTEEFARVDAERAQFQRDRIEISQAVYEKVEKVRKAVLAKVEA